MPQGDFVELQAPGLTPQQLLHTLPQTIYPSSLSHTVSLRKKRRMSISSKLASVCLVLLLFVCSCSCFPLYGCSQNITSSSVETFTVSLYIFNEKFLFNDIALPTTWPSQNLSTFDTNEKVHYFPVVTGTTTYLFRAAITNNAPLSPVLLSKDADYEVINLSWSLNTGLVYITVIENGDYNLYSFDPASLDVLLVVNLASVGIKPDFANLGAAHYYYYGVNSQYNPTSGQYDTNLVYFPLTSPYSSVSLPLSIGGGVPTAIYFDYMMSEIVGVANVENSWAIFRLDFENANTTIVYTYESWDYTLTTYDAQLSVVYFFVENSYKNWVYGWSLNTNSLVYSFVIPYPLVNVASDFTGTNKHEIEENLIPVK
eukprot:TRINITY_DN789_c0_g1_i2.p1 TRINITY_DN789_c0_g1~~TRINITY_DN789_c0_g1_i2.p1  ORF type:complete len:370 (+),score=62.79 TRINITY_DN789_c0_g1_i2:69-1178(+)